MNIERCERCIYSRAIVSENGLHPSCCMSPKTAMACLTGKKDRFREAIWKDRERKDNE